MMEACNIPFIPERLHQNNKPVITQFEVGEYLYKRCKEDELVNPYAAQSITELSHNRSGLKNNILCNPNDVLFSVREDDFFEKYDNLKVCTLVIKDLNENSNYRKGYTEIKNEIAHICVIELIHEPIPCMYPHCVFRISFDNNIVTFDNYRDTIGKFHKIRALLRQELASMILQREISQISSSKENF